MGGLEGGMTTSWEVFFEKGFVLNFLEKKRKGMYGMDGMGGL